MLLKNLIKVLGKEFELSEVTKEAVRQYEMEKVLLLADDLTFGRRVARIRAARIVFGRSYDEAKEWVEANFSDGGSGDSI